MSKLFDEKKFRDNLPSEMLSQKRWVRYFLKPKAEGGTAKVPIGINKAADHSDPSTWDTFNNCASFVEKGKHGLGYCFLGGDIHALDIDHCRNPKTGQLCPEAMKLLERINGWAEYSVSGQGIHVFFKGNVRGKQLTETCLQYWNPKNSPRFFALTCDMVGSAFTKLKDIGDEFNYVFATARHISAKIREELKTIDPEQWAALPDEREQPAEIVHEKPKTKSRKLHKDFDLEDFLKFYSLPIDNIAKNDLGTCYRLTTCPIKGGPHVGQNSTSTNFILSTDGGLGFHCQSTGCVDYSVAQVIEKLATEKQYPKPIYVETKKQDTSSPVKQIIAIDWSDTLKRESTKWLIPDFLPLCEVTAFSGEMDTRKSTTAIDIAAKGSTGGGQHKLWFNNKPFEVDPFSTIYAGTEDSFNSTVLNRFIAAGGNPKAFGRIALEVVNEKDSPDGLVQWTLPLSFDAHLNVLQEAIIQANKERPYPIGLLINDPLIAFFGDKNFNKAQDCQHILHRLKKLCEELKISIIDLMHYNKTQGASAKEKTGGSQRLIEAHRMAWGFTLIDEADKESNTLIAPIKKNLLRVAQSYEITTVSTPVDWEEEGIKKCDSVGVVKFVGLSDQTADGQLQEKEAKDKSQQRTIEEELLEALKSGKKAPGVVCREIMEAQRCSKSSVERAFRKLEKKSKVRKEGTGPSNMMWMLAASEQLTFDVDKKPVGRVESEIEAA